MLRKTDNKLLLQVINARNSWRHYIKTKPVWAKKLDADETVDTLEGPVTYRAGDYLCKGPSGDVWGQGKTALFKKYDPAPNTTADREGWQKFIPKPDAAGVMAATVDQDFSVRHPVWGTFNGRAGDYLVKSFEDKDTPYPDDIWIVKKDIFESTYEEIELDVFISYSQNDKKVADALCHLLESEKIRCWIAPRDILPGSDWIKSITEAIPNCKVFLIILTDEAIDSEYVRRELLQALKYGLKIIPIRLSDIELRNGFDFLLGNRHWLDAFPNKLKSYFPQILENILNNLSRPIKNFTKKKEIRKSKPKKAINILIIIALLSVIAFLMYDNFQKTPVEDVSLSELEASPLTNIKDSPGPNDKNFVVDSELQYSSEELTYADSRGTELKKQWFIRSTEGPFSRSNFSVTYDPFAGNTILHGGWGVDYSVNSIIRGGPSNLSDTWVWNDNSWEKISDGLALSNSAMVYDFNLGKIIAFGGIKGHLPHQRISETYIFEGNRWSLSTTEGPEARIGHDMVFDELRRTVLLFGGRARSVRITGTAAVFEHPLSDSWEWDGNKWSEIKVKGPEPRYGHKMIYDAKNEIVLLFGGYDENKLFDDTWIWDGKIARWTKLTPSKNPSARYNHEMVYDPINEKVLLFGGITKTNINLNDLWEWDGVTWSLIEQNTPLEPSGNCGMVYDNKRKKIILVVGSGINESTLSTWELKYE